MKKIFLTTTLVIMILVSSAASNRSHAFAIVCANCQTSVQGMLDLIKEGLIAGSTAVTAAKTTLSAINDTVLIPMNNALTLAMIIKSGTAVQNLVLGATGVDPLLVKNPEAYIQGKKIEVIQASLGEIAAQKSIYKESILGSVVADAKQTQGSTLATRVSTLSQSDIPAITKAENCTDAALSLRAKRDVSDADGNYTQTQFAARKAEISAAICGNVNDPKTQAALLAVSKSQFSWGTFGAITNGDNEWNRTVRIKQEITAEAEKKGEEKAKDLQSGGGIRSDTECTKRATTDVNGKAYTGASLAPCIQEEIRKTASTLNGLYMSSLDSPLKTLQAGFGSGAGSLLNTAFNSINLINGIRNGLDGSPSSGGGSGQSNTVFTLDSTPVNDLASNPKAKSTLTSAPKDFLQENKLLLSSLDSIDDKYLNALNLYKIRVDDMFTCFNDLLTQNPNLQNDAQINAAQDFQANFYNTQIDGTNALRVQLLAERAASKKEAALITTTLSKIEASQSSEEILNFFQSYQKQVKDEKMPDQTAVSNRESAFLQYQNDVKVSTEDGGELFNLENSCKQLTSVHGGGGSGGYSGPGGI